MPTTRHPGDGTQIYYEVTGVGPPLVILPGNSGSAALWRAMEYQPAFEGSYQVIAIDPRGHGHSDKSHDPNDYSVAQDAEDVIAVLDAVGVRAAHLFGYSMGARIALGTGALYPQRTRSVVAGGPATLVLTAPSPSAGFDSLDAFVEVMREIHEAHDTPVSDEFRDALLLNDMTALTARSDARDRDRLDPDWSSVTWPAFLYAGTEDTLLASARDYAARLPHAELFELEGADHIDAAVPNTHDQVFPRVQEFLSAAEERRTD